MKREIIIFSAFACMLSVAQGSLLITNLEAPAVIDFQSSVGWEPGDATPDDNVFKFGTGNQRDMVERGSATWTGGNDWGLSADAWQYQHTHYLSGVPSTFGDANNDGDMSDSISVITGLSVLQNSEAFGEGNYVVTLGAINTVDGNSGSANIFLTLRIQNGTGIAINEWSFFLDAWMHDASANNFSDFSIQYSTDNVNFTTLASVTGAGGGLQSLGTIGGTFNAAVAADEFLYVKMDSFRPAGSGNGTGYAFDNISVSAIPEPATWAAIIALAVTGLGFYRRRSK